MKLLFFVRCLLLAVKKWRIRSLEIIPFLPQPANGRRLFSYRGLHAFAAANKHFVSPTPADNVVGKPWIGAGGVQRTTAGIMADPAIVRTTSFAARPKRQIA